MYPAGTERRVEKYFLFTTEIGGINVRGLQTVMQVCNHKVRNDSGPSPTEEWHDKEVYSQ